LDVYGLNDEPILMIKFICVSTSGEKDTFISLFNLLMRALNEAYQGREMMTPSEMRKQWIRLAIKG